MAKLGKKLKRLAGKAAPVIAVVGAGTPLGTLALAATPLLAKERRRDVAARQQAQATAAETAEGLGATAEALERVEQRLATPPPPTPPFWRQPQFLLTAGLGIAVIGVLLFRGR